MALLGVCLALLPACSRQIPEQPAATPASAPASAPAASNSQGPADGYDIARMDLKPVPSAVSAERHTGSFALGASLNPGAALKPLDPSPVKEVRLDTTHKVIDIAPGVKFSAWTFGDTVPTPRRGRSA